VPLLSLVPASTRDVFVGSFISIPSSEPGPPLLLCTFCRVSVFSPLFFPPPVQYTVTHAAQQHLDRVKKKKLAKKGFYTHTAGEHVTAISRRATLVGSKRIGTANGPFDCARQIQRAAFYTRSRCLQSD